MFLEHCNFPCVYCVFTTSYTLMYFVQHCNFAMYFIQPFDCLHSPLESCIKYIESMQRCKLSMIFLQDCNKHKKKCNVAQIACISLQHNKSRESLENEEVV